MAFASDDRRNVDALFVVFGKSPDTSRMKRGPLEMEMRNRSRLETSGYLFVAAVHPLFCQQIWRSVVIRIARLAFASSLLLFFLISGALGQAPQDAQQPNTTDSEYRKFDDRLSSLRARIAQTYAISSPNGIDEGQFVTIGDIEQWITIRGWDRDNPVLLFLHGGPGDVTNPWTFALFAPWEKHFTVVQWDQRGAGRTLRKSGPAVAPIRQQNAEFDLMDWCRRKGRSSHWRWQPAYHSHSRAASRLIDLVSLLLILQLFRSRSA